MRLVSRNGQDLTRRFPDLAAEGQQAGKVRRVGILSVGAAPVARSPFLVALRDLGWMTGQDIAFEPRHAEGQPDRLPALAAEIVGLKVDVIHRWTTSSGP